jgi:tRNA(Leu) C34 or U34 (ribose-2'-O)-methylase TrmL
MEMSAIEFYECLNPTCRLRFPVVHGQLKNKRCPLCRSSLNLATTLNTPAEVNPGVSSLDGWWVEALVDNVRSAWNVGSIFRTADGTGIKKLHLCGITPTPENARVGKTALGAELCVPWAQANNSLVLAGRLKVEGYRIWALEDTPEAVPLYEMELSSEMQPLILIVGNEVCGVDPGLLSLCDQVLAIPMLGKKQSYNVAVAFGMAASFLFYCHSLSHGSRKILPCT